MNYSKTDTAALRSMKRRVSKLIVPVLGILFATAGIVLASSGGGDHGAAAHGGGWAATDTYRVMNFAVLAIALFFLLKKPVTQFLGDRIQTIQQQLEELEAQKAAAEQKLAQYNAKISALGAESEKIVEQYRQQGIALKEKILEEAAAAAQKLEEQAKRTIDHEFSRAKLQLETEVFEQAIAKAEEKIKKSITGQDQDLLVSEYLTKVVKN